MPTSGFQEDVSTVLKMARTFLNDDNATVWTDPVLIPKIQEAWRELQTMMWEIGSPAVRGVSFGNVIGVNQGTLLVPSNDMLCPFRLMEASNPPANNWELLTEVSFIEELILRNVVPGTKIGYWAWRGEVLYLQPATVQRQVTVFYRVDLGDLNAAGDPLRILGSELYLSARVAAMAAGASGNKDVYDAMTALAKENFNRVVFANRGQQKPVYRP